MNFKEGICDGCGKKKLIVNQFHKRCYVCNNRRISRVKGNTPRKTKTLREKERDMMKGIFDRSNHKGVIRSDISMKPIEGFRQINYHHIFPKGSYEQYRLLLWNIIIVTDQEHKDIHSGEWKKWNKQMKKRFINYIKKAERKADKELTGYEQT